MYGGEGGIRTLGAFLTHTHFPGVLLKPLGHLSVTLTITAYDRPWCAAQLASRCAVPASLEARPGRPGRALAAVAARPCLAFAARILAAHPLGHLSGITHGATRQNGT